MAPSSLLLNVAMAISLSTAFPTDSTNAIARPQEAALSTVERRGFNGEGAASLADAVANFLAPANAYDPSVSNKCTVTMETYAGGNCVTYVNCDKTDSWGVISNPPTWSVCHLNGRQFFTDENIGDYSITFTQAGGQNGNTEDGLHHPILQVADVGNWDPIDVQAEADKQAAAPNPSGFKPKGGYLCQWLSGKGGGSAELVWQCGIPTIGADGAFGISSNTIVHAPGFSPGRCTFHIVQYQRDENGIGGTYAFDVKLLDAKGTPIGQISKVPADPKTLTVNMNSNLPYVLVITANGNDVSPVGFAYGGSKWQSDDKSHCNMGGGKDNGYQGGSRQGDCGFTC